MSNVLRKEPCPKCREKNLDKSGDNLTIYSNSKGEADGYHCFACGYTKLSSEYKKENGLEKDVYKETVIVGDFDLDMWQRLKDSTSNKTKGFRGIREDTATKFGVRHSFDEDTGEVTNQYYPVTKGGELSGVKWRIVNPKDFRARGEVGADADLFGQVNFQNSVAKSVIIFSGELDMLSGYQMLHDYYSEKYADKFDIPVVSSTSGEGSRRQFQKQYEFLNRFEKIYICPDKDSAGEAALHKLAAVLPKGKVFVIDLPKKDANDMLTAGLEKEFVNRYFKARAYSPSGIVGSDVLYDAMMDAAFNPKLPLPPFLATYEEMLAGGIEIKSIVNLIANTSIGKTTLVNECVYYWIFNSPYKVGILTLELNKVKYSEALSSRHLGKKLALIKEPQDKVDYLAQPHIKQKIQDMMLNADGSPRFWLMEERDGKLSKVKELIEQMIISCGCQIIIIDPLQDILAGCSIDEQELFAAWMKIMIAAYDVTFVCINHTRKPPGGTDPNKMPDEYDIKGSGSIIQSGFLTMVFHRNKTLEGIDKNITELMATKNRQTGETGLAGFIYYCNETHTLYDLKEAYALFPERFKDLPEKYHFYLGIQPEEY